MISISTSGSITLQVLFLKRKVYTKGQGVGFMKSKITGTTSNFGILMSIQQEAKKRINIQNSVFNHEEKILMPRKSIQKYTKDQKDTSDLTGIIKHTSVFSMLC